MAGANLTSGANYTLMLADASALGNPDAQGDYRHYLANNVQAPSDFNVSTIGVNLAAARHRCLTKEF